MGKLFNLARMTTATTGTGNISLGIAVSGYLTFAQAGVANGDVVSYAIKDGANSEIGEATYSTTGPALNSRTVTRSTNSNAAINLSGTAEVFITPRAEDLTPNPTNAVLGADVSMPVSGTWYSGPSISLGTGVWFVIANITVQGSGTGVDSRVWDGTTLIGSADSNVGGFAHMTIAGFITNPVANVRVDCRDIGGSATSKITFNRTGLGKDTQINAFRIA